jgi:LysM repeat protein
MNLRDKYSKLLDYARSSNVENLSIAELNNVLYITGSAYASVKDRMWTIYDEVDPNMRAGDLVMNITVVPGGEEIYEIKAGDSLSKIAKKYPDMTWQKIFEVNKDTIKDPDKIFPGQKIKIPL